MGKHSFQKIEETEIREIGASAALYRHLLGAEFYHIKNHDREKVFGIGFRTYPDSDGGTAHILEHAVFSGSEKYPLKEPFVDLMKGSLNTFLNAMTMADCTIYPVASPNTKDLLNLADVYLDAVFHPLIEEDPTIFMQEGGHFEQDEEGNVYLNGVVYNEEKGAMSSPEMILRHRLNQAMFKGPYGCFSGGVPDAMIGMDGRQIVDFHRRFYCPANARFFLYGDIDPEPFFQKIEDAIAGLVHGEKASVLEDTCRITEPVVRSERYPAAGDMDICGMEFYLGTSSDPKRLTALQIIVSALFQFETSPVRRALVDEGICTDLTAEVDGSRQEAVLELCLYDVSVSAAEEIEAKVLRAIEETKEDELIALMDAALANMTFTLRESEFGDTPRGVAYCIQLLSGNASQDDPFRDLRYEEDLEAVAGMIASGEILGVMKKYISNNPRRLTIRLGADETLIDLENEEEERRVQKEWDNLSDEQKQEHLLLLERLFEKQDSPDDPEQVAKLPKLMPEDIEEAPIYKDVVREPLGKEHTEEPGKGDPHELWYYESDKRGIAYIRLYFPVKDTGAENLFALSTIGMLLGDLPTKGHGASELERKILKVFGGFEVYLQAFRSDVYMVCDMKLSSEKLEDAMALAGEILMTSDFSDAGAVRSRLSTALTGFRTDTVEDAMHFAAEQAAAMVNTEAALSAEISGIQYFKRLDELLDESDEMLSEHLASFCESASSVMTGHGVRTCVIAEEQDKERIREHAGLLLQRMKEKQSAYKPEEQIGDAAEDGASRNVPSRVGYAIPSQVQYIARACKYGEKTGAGFDGRFYLLRNVLESDYLWTRIRLKNGAYGSSFIMARDGYFLLTSHSDPGLSQSLEDFSKTADYVRNLDLSEEEIFRLKLGSLAAFDRPMSAPEAGDAAIERAMRGLTVKDIYREREELLDAGIEDLVSMGDILEEGLATERYAVFGGRGMLEENRELFEEIVEI